MRKLQNHLLIAICGLFLHLAYVSHWADSELWAINLAQTTHALSLDASLIYKPLFYFVLNKLYLTGFDSVNLNHLARALFAALGVIHLILTFAIALTILKSKRRAALATLLLASSSLFLSQGFRVRSDILAITFQLSSLLCFLRFVQKPRTAWALAAAVLHLLMLASTPKAIYFIIINICFYVLYAMGSDNRQTIKRFFYWSLIPVIVGAIGVVTVRFSHFTYAANYFFSGFAGTAFGESYSSAKSFNYVFRFIRENILFSILIFAAIHSAFPILSAPVENTTRFKKPLFGSFLICLLVIIFHNERLPFFIASLLPLIAIASGYVFFSYVKKPLYISLFTLALFAQAVHFYTDASARKTNSEQITAIKELERYLALYPDVRIFDTVGVVPRRNTFFHYIDPTVPTNFKDIREFLKSEKPALIFFSNKMFIYGQKLLPLLRDLGYINIGSGIYAQAFSFSFDQYRDIKKLKTLSSVPLKNVLSYASGEGSLASDKPLYFYYGHSYINTVSNGETPQITATTFQGFTEPLKDGLQKEEVLSQYKEIIVTGNYSGLAISVYKPVHFPGGKPFFKLFDFDFEN